MTPALWTVVLELGSDAGLAGLAVATLWNASGFVSASEGSVPRDWHTSGHLLPMTCFCMDRGPKTLSAVKIASLLACPSIESILGGFVI